MVSMDGRTGVRQLSGQRVVRFSAAGLLLAALAACGSDEPEPLLIDESPGETRVTYDCEGGRGFEALFRSGREDVVLLIDGQELVLPQVMAASGVAFSDGAFTFRAKGLEAYTEGWPGGDYVACTGTNS